MRPPTWSLETGHSIAQWFGGTFQPDLGFQIILPLGISFYTFQTVSHAIDVYRGLQEPIWSFPLFLTYVTFWPQLVAGPILRADEVVPQLEDYRPPTAAAVLRGLDEIPPPGSSGGSGTARTGPSPSGASGTPSSSGSTGCRSRCGHGCPAGCGGPWWPSRRR